MKTLTAIFAFFFIHATFGQDIETKDSVGKKGLVERLFDTADGAIDLISGESWTFIPAVTYSPETSLGLGVRAIKVFRYQNVDQITTRPSTLPITFLYTLNKQAIFTAELNLWKKENQAYINSRIELTDYPFKFYGIGNELSADNEEFYSTRYVYFHINYEKRILPGLYIGPRYEFRLDDIYKKEAGGILDNNLAPGSDGQRVSGLGLAVNYDTRNNIFQPLSGSFHQLSMMSFQSFFGSNFTFNQYMVDLRKYIPVYKGQVLALQAWQSFTTGNPPFQHVSLIGGSDIMRGYFEGRYRDKHALVYQAEYRVPVYRNLGLVFFGSTGQVSNAFSDFSWNRFRYGGGLGFRYKLNGEGLNIRLDIAIGDQRAFYFGLNEVL